MSNVHTRRSWWLPSSAETPEGAYVRRRELLAAMGVGGVIAGSGLAWMLGGSLRAEEEVKAKPPVPAGNESYYDGLEVVRNELYTVPERGVTPEKLATTYNNFYEFTTDKERVHRLVGDFVVHPWQIEVKGLVDKPGKLDIEELIRETGVEERLYRFRCVEAWSMTVPWSGIPMKKLIDRISPKAEARYAIFRSFLRPEQAPGQRQMTHYAWPYYEGFELKELTSELALLATGIYGKPLPRQNGAPVRVIMPWKYGLKCIKSIVSIELVRERPHTFWNDAAPNEYSFHSNVEPDVPHPRWSQATERLIDDGSRIETQIYNGYGDLVADLYKR